MPEIEKSIDVNVPVRTAYDRWTQFEELPRFMEGVKSVRQLDARTLEWAAVITQQEPDQRIGWRSVSETVNAGSVTFESLGDERCRVTLRLNYTPEAAIERTGSALGVLTTRVDGDLKRFQEFVERRGHETDAWRETTRTGRVSAPPRAPGSKQ